MSEKKRRYHKKASKESAKLSKRNLLLLGLITTAFIVAGCATQTEADVKASLPVPGISPSSQLFYTNDGNISFPAQFSNSNRTSGYLTPEGGSLSVGDMVTVSRLPIPNQEYTLTLSAQNCTDFKGQDVCTDPVVSNIRLIYDTIPPEFTTESVVIANGKIIFNLLVPDNLSGTQYVTIGGNTYSSVNNRITVEVNPDQEGNNQYKATTADNAGNKKNYYPEADYRPFDSIVMSHTVNPDGTITFRAQGNSNIDLSKTSASGVQQKVPLLERLGKDVSCDQPQTVNDIVSINCSIPDDRGFVTLDIVFYDKNGFTRNETHKIKDVPDLSDWTKLLYALGTAVAIGGISYTTFRKVRKVQDAHYREFTTDLTTAIMSGNYETVRENLDFTRKKERQGWAKFMADAQNLDLAKKQINGGNIVGSYVFLNNSIIDQPRKELWPRRQHEIDQWVGLLDVEVNKIMAVKRFETLAEKFDLMQVVHDVAFVRDKKDILWEAIGKNRQLVKNLFELAFVYSAKYNIFWDKKGQKNVAAYERIRRYPLPGKLTEVNTLFETLCEWAMLQEAGDMITAVERVQDKIDYYFNRLRIFVFDEAVRRYFVQKKSGVVNHDELAAFLDGFDFVLMQKPFLLKELRVADAADVELRRNNLSLAFKHIMEFDLLGPVPSLTDEFKRLSGDWFDKFSVEIKPILDARDINLLVSSQLAPVIRGIVSVSRSNWFWKLVEAKGGDLASIYLNSSFVLAMHEGRIWEPDAPLRFSDLFNEYFIVGNVKGVEKFNQFFAAGVEWNLLNQSYRLVITNDMGSLKDHYVRVLRNKAQAIIMADFNRRLDRYENFDGSAIVRLVSGFEFLRDDRELIVGNLERLHRQTRVLGEIRLTNGAATKLEPIVEKSLENMRKHVFEGGTSSFTAVLVLAETVMAIYKGDRSRESLLDLMPENDLVLAFDFFLRNTQFVIVERIVGVVNPPLKDQLQQEYEGVIYRWRTDYLRFIELDPHEALIRIRSERNIGPKLRAELETAASDASVRKDNLRKIEQLKKTYKGTFPEELFRSAVLDYKIGFERAEELVPTVDVIVRKKALVTGEFFHLVGFSQEEAIELKKELNGSENPPAALTEKFKTMARKKVIDIVAQCGLIESRSDEQEKTGTYIHSNFSPEQRFTAHNVTQPLTNLIKNRKDEWWAEMFVIFIMTMGKKFKSRSLKSILF